MHQHRWKELVRPHQPRAQISAALRRLKSKGLRGPIPGQYLAKNLMTVERNELDAGVSEDAIRQARFSGRSVADHYIVETVLEEDGTTHHVVERNGEKWVLGPQVAETMQKHLRQLVYARAADAKAAKILTRYGRAEGRDDAPW